MAMGEIKLSLEQTKALAGLRLLHNKSRRDVYFNRVTIGAMAKHSFQSFKVATMRRLQKHGLVETLSDERVSMVESGECRCGCDQWRLTEAGFARTDQMNIVHAKKEEGSEMTTDERAKRNRAIAERCGLGPKSREWVSEHSKAFRPRDWDDGCVVVQEKFSAPRVVDYTRSVDDCIEACGVLKLGASIDREDDGIWSVSLKPLDGNWEDDSTGYFQSQNFAEALSAAIEAVIAQTPDPARSSPSAG